jgi:quercetin dioxygenase-like cupin family protein
MDHDALIAAPDHHRLLLENDVVRVLETLVEPKSTVPLHAHAWPAVNYVVSFSHFIRRDEAGKIVLDTEAQGVTLVPGESVWAQPLELHTLENVGSETLRVVSIEIKPRG